MPIPTLKIKKLTNTARMPIRMTEGAAGYDIYTDEAATIRPHMVTKIHTGLAVSIPQGYHMEIHIRSSWGKRGVHLANCTGIIDSDYRGEILLMLMNDTNDLYFAAQGERIAQFILVKDSKYYIKEVDELDETERGEGGFGSTNKKETK